MKAEYPRGRWPARGATGGRARRHAQPLTPDALHAIDAYWRAANYLSVGQIYLYANALLKEPLRLEHIKPRLLGHWGTTPGLNFLYAHLNRVISAHDLSVLFVTGPGHGGPALVANTYLEGTYSEVYPEVSQDEAGMNRLFKQFSFPGGVPSHVAPETPGSIHEGGELGYSLAHAYGAAFDNPDLLVACVVGDGEAETGPLATSWHANKFLNPERDGAVLPILHLNGYKIAGPTVLARIPREELTAFLEGVGHTPYFVEGDDPATMHQLMAATLDRVIADIRAIQHDARTRGFRARPRWPMIVLVTPKGWTGPKRVDGKKIEGTFRAHQVPLGEMRDASGTRADARALDEELPAAPALRRGRQAQCRTRRAGAFRRVADGRQSARQRRRAAAAARATGLQALRRRRRASRRRRRRSHARAGRVHSRRAEGQREELSHLQPRRDDLQPLGRRFLRHRSLLGRRGPFRRRPRRPRRARDGGPVRAPVRRMARRLPADRPPRLFLLLRGVHPHHRLDVQPAREVAQGVARDPVAPADRLAQHPAVVARVAAGPQRLFAPGPGLHRSRRSTRRPRSSACTCRPTRTRCCA